MIQTLLFFPTIYCASKVVLSMYNKYYNVQYDTHEIPCIIMRFFQGFGTIYMTSKYLYSTYSLPLFFSHIAITQDVHFIYEYSLSYFLWDTLFTYIGNDPQKYLFIAHHSACLYIILFSQVSTYEPKDLILGLFVSEITNPIYQCNDLLLFTKYKYNSDLIFLAGCSNFISIYLIRGIVFPHLLFVWFHSYNKNYQYIQEQSISYQLYIYSLLLTMIGISIGSYVWLYHKYNYLITYYR